MFSQTHESEPSHRSGTMIESRRVSAHVLLLLIMCDSITLWPAVSCCALLCCPHYAAPYQNSGSTPSCPPPTPFILHQATVLIGFAVD